MVGYNMGGSVPQTFTVRTAAQSQQGIFVASRFNKNNISDSSWSPHKCKGFCFWAHKCHHILASAYIGHWPNRSEHHYRLRIGYLMITNAHYRTMIIRDMAGSDGVFRNVYAGSSTTYPLLWIYFIYFDTYQIWSHIVTSKYDLPSARTCS